MKNILVALDLTDTDETVIRYAHFLKGHVNVNDVHFVHNIKIDDVDDLIQELLGEKDIKTVIQKNLVSKISKYFADINDYTLTILQNKNTEYSISDLAEKNAVSTILLGFKREGYGTAAMSQKLIRIFNGDILLVPESAQLRWDRILVPTDLSGPFQLINQKLQKLQALKPQPEIRILKSFSIPSFFFPLIDDKKAIDQAHEHIVKQYAEARKKYAVNDNFAFVARYQDDQNVVDIIKKENKSFKADLIMMAAKGASNIPSIFIGSTINEIINTDPFQVIYILKQRD